MSPRTAPGPDRVPAGRRRRLGPEKGQFDLLLLDPADVRRIDRMNGIRHRAAALTRSGLSFRGPRVRPAAPDPDRHPVWPVDAAAPACLRSCQAGPRIVPTASGAAPGTGVIPRPGSPCILADDMLDEHQADAGAGQSDMTT